MAAARRSWHSAQVLRVSRAAGIVHTTAVRVWHGHERAVANRELVALADSNGFVPVQMPDGAPRDTVLILAPVNCPSDGAKRADALADHLRKLDFRDHERFDSRRDDQRQGESQSHDR